jgi:methyltransferase family protein
VAEAVNRPPRPSLSARMRRALGPLTPILRPIWHRVQPVISGASPWSPPVLLERARARREAGARRARNLPEPRIRPLRNFELIDLGIAEPYYRPRRVYMNAAGRIAAEMIERKGLQTALELGPHLRPLIVGADAIDIVHNDRLQSEGRLIVHDATQAPWPFPDKSYDLFVGLQVFEHLGTRQPDAFREVRRVARNAILSLPIDWVMADPRNCHHLLTNERVLSWFAPVVPTRVEVGNGGHRKRLLYVFEDLPAPSAD